MGAVSMCVLGAPESLGVIVIVREFDGFGIGVLNSMVVVKVDVSGWDLE